MIRDMSDAALAAYIADLTASIALNFALRRVRGTRWMLRHLDIAVAVRSRRIRDGVWNGGNS